MGLSAAFPRADLARRRRFEWRVYYRRSWLLPPALALVLVLHAPPLWLSLAALAGCALHNLFRLALIARASIVWLRWGGGSLFALDTGVLLIGVWPLAADGARAAQIVLVLLLIEATRRLRSERPPVFVTGIALVTAMLCGYAVAVMRSGEEWGSVLVWVGMLIGVAALGLRTYHQQTHRPMWMGYREPAMEDGPSPEPAASPQSQGIESEVPLSPRQREVIRLLARGLSTREIAEELSVSVETVRGHVKGMYRALRAHNRDEAVRRARERGDLE